MKLDILAFGAHPDDVELSSAGTLLKSVRSGATVGIIALTRGEMGTRGSEDLRAKEFAQAAKIIGAKVHEALDMTDGNLTVDNESKQIVIQQIRKYRPTLLLVPFWDDRHPDHGNASRIIEEAAFLSGLKKIDTAQEPHRPAQLIYYMMSWDFEPDFVVDISNVIEEKKQAIMAYSSQVHNKSYLRPDEDETFISSPQFMEMLMTRASYYGHRIGRKFAEPFKTKTTIEIKDLLKTFGDRVY